MTIFEKIRQRILKFLKLEHLSDNPQGERYTFINDENTVKRQHLNENRIWYVGDSDELENYYTVQNVGGFAKEPIYNRNKRQYFWGIAVTEHTKKVHSGIPRAIVDTLSNAIGMPDITIEDEEKNEVIKKLIEVNAFTTKLTQEARPLTLVEGWGGWKIVWDKGISDYPIFQYYEGKDVEFVVKNGIVIGMIFKDYYKYKNKDYVLMETRRIDKTDSIVEFELFKLSGDNVEKVNLDTIDELKNLPVDGYRIPGLKKILGVPCRYFFDLFDKDHGRSIFQGKLDVFDDIDQCLSQASQTDRVSTPVEYYPTDVLEKDGNGNTQLPSVYNRQYVKSVSFPDGDGNIHGEIKTTQPQLNFEQYIARFKALIDVAITGILSPASMGIDIAKKDNADAQREKEKVTIYTRNNVMASEEKELKNLLSLGLMMKEYMDTNKITLTDYDISVKYCEFANPTFESMSRILTPMWTQGAISTEMYVDKLYGDSLSDEEKQSEIEKLNANRQQDNIELGDFGLNGDKDLIGGSGGAEARAEEAISGVEE